MSYIIEGKKGIVVLEPALFVENIREFDAYIKKLNKPIEKVIINYHSAGFNGFDADKLVMIEGMPGFVQGDIYKGMMSNFSAGFGDAIEVSDFVPSATVGKQAKVNWAGVDFAFFPGASSDFPAASILIGGKAYYMHFAPVANMHISPLQIPNRQAVDATLAALEQAKASGATTFIGGHGMSVSNSNDLDFQIAYLQKVKETMLSKQTADAFIQAMQTAYPNNAAADNLPALAANLYK